MLARDGEVRGRGIALKCCIIKSIIKKPSIASERVLSETGNANSFIHLRVAMAYFTRPNNKSP